MDLIRCWRREMDWPVARDSKLCQDSIKKKEKKKLMRTKGSERSRIRQENKS